MAEHVKNLLGLIVIVAGFFLLSCTKEKLSVNNDQASAEAIKVEFGQLSFALSQIQIPVALQNADTISLSPEQITLTSSSLSCSISVANGTSANPTILLSNCSGQGSFTLTVASGVATSNSGATSELTTSSAYDFNSVAPTIAISAPVRSGYDHTFTVVYTGATTVNLTSSHVSALVTRHMECGGLTIANGDQTTAQVTVTNCKGLGALSLAITFGSSTNSSGISDSGAISASYDIVSRPGDFNDQFVMAYSVRKLSPSYSGPAVKLRRSSDNATQDIDFAADGFVDNTQITTFLGGSNGYVEIWYDQSGNGYHASQTDTTLQPQLDVNPTNGKYAVEFLGNTVALHGLATSVNATTIGTDLGSNFELSTTSKAIFASYQATTTDDRVLFSNYNVATCPLSPACQRLEVRQGRPLTLNAGDLHRYGRLEVDSSPAVPTTSVIANVDAKYESETVTCNANTIACTSYAPSSPSTASIDSGSVFAIGRKGPTSTDNSTHFRGKIHEIFIYGNDLTNYDKIKKELDIWD